MTSTPRRKPHLLVRALLWIAAVALMAGAAVYQRSTGPTYPLRGEFEAEGQVYPYELSRSGTSTHDEDISLDAPEGAVGAVRYRRYPTSDEFTVLEMAFEPNESGGTTLSASLPRQPAAGKLEYDVWVRTGGQTINIPDAPVASSLASSTADATEPTIIIRFKDPVPVAILVPHVLFMFFAVLIGMHAGLAAIFAPSLMRRSATISLIGMTIGGMILGPIVQKNAFGAYWTGFPFGYDLTDNKMLIMWLVWLVAFGVMRATRRKADPE
jgi:hypothetical protein